MERLFDVSVFGDKALTRSLDDLSNKIQKQYMRKSLRAGTKLVADIVRRNTPVLTGRLRRGIKVRAGKRSRSRIGYFVLLPTRAQLGIDPKSKWYYPAVLEWGGITKTGRVIPALGFMRRSLDASREPATNKVAQTLWTLIRTGLPTRRAAA